MTQFVTGYHFSSIEVNYAVGAKSLALCTSYHATYNLPWYQGQFSTLNHATVPVSIFCNSRTQLVSPIKISTIYLGNPIAGAKWWKNPPRL